VLHSDAVSAPSPERCRGILLRHKKRKRAGTGPNQGLELTASSVRYAPASGSSSGLAVGRVQHTVARHWASPRENESIRSA
jgi:hypothetical protein